MKTASSLNVFKTNLEIFKSKSTALGTSGGGHYWDIFDEVLNRIGGGSYLENKIKHNSFLKDNPFVAKKQAKKYNQVKSSLKNATIYTNFRTLEAFKEQICCRFGVYKSASKCIPMSRQHVYIGKE